MGSPSSLVISSTAQRIIVDDFAATLNYGSATPYGALIDFGLRPFPDSPKFSQLKEPGAQPKIKSGIYAGRSHRHTSGGTAFTLVANDFEAKLTITKETANG
jgi:hypothetical protein